MCIRDSTNTTVVNVPRLPDFSIDEDAVLARVAEGEMCIRDSRWAA